MCSAKHFVMLNFICAKQIENCRIGHTYSQHTYKHICGVCQCFRFCSVVHTAKPISIGISFRHCICSWENGKNRSTVWGSGVIKLLTLCRFVCGSIIESGRNGRMLRCIRKTIHGCAASKTFCLEWNDTNEPYADNKSHACMRCLLKIHTEMHIVWSITRSRPHTHKLEDQSKIAFITKASRKTTNSTPFQVVG